jgi:hypothetical protein
MFVYMNHWYNEGYSSPRHTLFIRLGPQAYAGPLSSETRRLWLGQFWRQDHPNLEEAFVRSIRSLC